MRKLKKIMLLVLMGVMSMNNIGCKPFMSKEKQAKQFLEEKYNEEFEIKQVRGSNLFDDYYTVIAYPVERPEVVFKAVINLDGSGGSDYYGSKLFFINFSNQFAGE